MGSISFFLSLSHSFGPNYMVAERLNNFLAVMVVVVGIPKRIKYHENVRVCV